MMRSGSRGVGDDEEDLQAGQDDLFGRSTAAPINLADDGAGDGAAANVAGAADEETVSTGAMRNRPSTYDVCHYKLNPPIATHICVAKGLYKRCYGLYQRIIMRCLCCRC